MKCTQCSASLAFDDVGAHCEHHGLIITWEEINHPYQASVS